MAAPAKAARPAPAPEPETEGGTGKLRWVLGWIVLPGTIIAALFLTGVHVGARAPERGLPRLLLKVFGGKPGIAAEPGPPQEAKPRPGAKAGEVFSFSAVLQPKELQAIAEKSLGLSVDELSCEQVCRAYYKATYELAVYTVEQCELGRAVSWTSSMLTCGGKLEAVGQPTQPAKDDAKKQPEGAR
jgi:hypothetical protein